VQNSGTDLITQMYITAAEQNDKYKTCRLVAHITYKLLTSSIYAAQRSK